MADEPVTRPDLPMPAADYDLVRRASDLLSEAAADGLPGEVWELARHVYANWHIGDPGDGRLHAALLVAGRLIRAGERERLGLVPLSASMTEEQAAEFRERFEAAMANPGPPKVLPPLRTGEQWAVAWDGDHPDGPRVEFYDDEEDAADHLDQYPEGAYVASREIRWGPWRRKTGTERSGGNG